MAKDPDQRFATTVELADAARHALRPPAQRQAEAVGLRTPAAATRSPSKAATTAKPPASSPTKTQRPAAKPVLLQRLGRRKAIPLAALVLIASVITVSVIAEHGCSHQPAPPQPSAPPSPPSQTVHNPQPSQVELPFTGLKAPAGVAVDTVGNVYVTDEDNNRVLKLPAGSNTQAELPFTGLKSPVGVAVDTAGNVYVTDARQYRVLKLPAGSTPRSSCRSPASKARRGGGGHRRQRLRRRRRQQPGAQTAGGLEHPDRAAVHRPERRLGGGGGQRRQRLHHRVQQQPGAQTAGGVEHPGRAAVHRPEPSRRGGGGHRRQRLRHSSPKSRNYRVLKLPAGSSTPVELPFTDLTGPAGWRWTPPATSTSPTTVAPIGC